MIEKVISGMQSGSDIGSIKAAVAVGIQTGGTMPLGWLTEDGPKPEYEWLYNAKQHSSSEYPPRTAANVADANFTIWLGRTRSSGYWCTINAANRAFKPFGSHEVLNNENADILAKRILLLNYKIINCAGNRESHNPGIAEKVEKFLTRVFSIVRGFPLDGLEDLR